MREEAEVRRYYTGEVYWTVIIKDPDGQGDVFVGRYDSESEARMVATEIEEGVF
tara:strand:+ start:944 stop:1105 length:162 start_codon:yes stop_codon:yes gene_type:complete